MNKKIAESQKKIDGYKLDLRQLAKESKEGNEILNSVAHAAAVGDRAAMEDKEWALRRVRDAYTKSEKITASIRAEERIIAIEKEKELKASRVGRSSSVTFKA